MEKKQYLQGYLQKTWKKNSMYQVSCECEIWNLRDEIGKSESLNISNLNPEIEKNWNQNVEMWNPNSKTCKRNFKTWNVKSETQNTRNLSPGIGNLQAEILNVKA